jgi:hypothetical protein
LIAKHARFGKNSCILRDFIPYHKANTPFKIQVTKVTLILKSTCDSALSTSPY